MITGFLLVAIKTILSICFVLGSIVMVHELGHYLTAKLTGIWVIEFALGIGHRLFKFRWGETVYSLRSLPLGGFVKLAGMDAPEDGDTPEGTPAAQATPPEGTPVPATPPADGTAAATATPAPAAPAEEPDEENPILAPDDPRGYPVKSRKVKILVLAAGSIMNLTWAVVLFFLIYIISGGPLSNISVLDVAKGQPAALAGIRPGDVIAAINGTPIEEWTDGISIIQQHGGREITLDVVRDHPLSRPGFGGGLLQGDFAGDRGPFLLYKRENLKILVTPTNATGSGKIGISLAPNNYDFRVLPTSRAITKAFESTFSIITQTVFGIFRMVTGETQADVAGPVKIMQMIKEQSHKGLSDLLYLTALLSINIGLINMFPFPVLDGGRIVFVLLEAILSFVNFLTGLRLAITPLWEERIHFVGMLFLLCLLVLVTFQDIRSLF